MPVLTKAQQVENYVRNSIQRGAWSPGQKLPEPIKISSRLGVSVNTVKTTLARLASEGVVERKQKLGTFVAELPRTATVVILAREEVVMSVAGQYYKSLLNEARSCLKAHGYKVVLVSGHGNTPEEFYDSIHLFERPFCNEVVGILSLIELSDMQQRIAQAGMNAVSIAPGSSTDKYSVILDYHRMIEIAIEELKRRGYDDFALMYPEPMESEADVPLQKELDALRRDAVGCDESRLIPVPFSWDWRNAYQVFKDYWNNGSRASAVFFLDDAICDVASRAIGELGISIPDDLAVITHANVGSYFHTAVPLARIQFDPKDLVSHAWEMLNEIIDGKTIDAPHRFIPPRLLSGDSL